MSRFQRDNDTAAFTATTDVTAGEPSRSASASPTKRSLGTVSSSEQLRNDEEALASLRKRMAGPSSSKAGLATDQDEINRKIYEASKGSKYFENEKRNDERITRQINAMLSRRDEILRQTPEGSEAWTATERRVDEQMLALEAQRDLTRIILHADMDMFYAAVELKRDPSLKGKAFGVGSGVLVTASYEARQMGCRSGMATHVALALCPHLIVVKNDMNAYVEASKSVMAIFEHYDPNYAQMSLDEAYMDITPYCEMNNMTADAVVTEVRRRVVQDTGLTVSVGIAPNKMLAKISSDKNKPNGQFRVHFNRNFIMDLMHDLPCRKIPGIGRVTERILSSLSVNTCGDIWRARTILHLTLGDIGWLLNAYLGIHSNVVEPAKRGERKSVGREHTFRPTRNPAELKDYLRQSAEQVEKDLERLDYRGKTITLVGKSDNFQRFTRAKTMDSYQWKALSLYSVTSRLLDAEFVARGGAFAMRLIGVRVTNLKDLREPEHGGIKRLFEQAQASSPRKKAKMEDFGEASFEHAMQCALQLSTEADQSSVGYESKPFSPQRVYTEDGNTNGTALCCPICERKIRATDNASDPAYVNAKLNEHIDRCLAGEECDDVDMCIQTNANTNATIAVRSTPASASAANTKAVVQNNKRFKGKKDTKTLDAFFGRQP